HRAVDGPQQVGDVLGGALGIVDRAVVVRVGGADVGQLVGAGAPGEPGHHEDRALVLGDRHHHGDVVADPLPRHGDVDALGGADRVGRLALVEPAHLVGPDA